MDFSVRSEYGLIYFIAAIVLSALAAYFCYRRSDAPATLKKVLTVLRFLSVLLILLLFMSPVLSLTGKKHAEPLSVFLIDNSKSMLAGNKAGEMLIEQLAASAPGSKRFFLFSDGITGEADAGELPVMNPDSSGNITDLSKTFKQLQEELKGENISSVTVISDGIANRGGNPVQDALALGAPVNFAMASDTSGFRDISINKLFFNRTAFVESSVPVKAQIKAVGINAALQVRLTEDGKTLDSREVNITPEKNSYSVDFSVSSQSQKSSLFRIEIDSVQGEATTMNNFSEFIIKFVDNKFKLLVLAGAPSPDYAFIKEEILKIRNFETTFRTQKASGEYYEGPSPDVKAFDAVILIGFPTSISDDDLLLEIRKQGEAGRIPVLFFSSRNIDYSRLNVIESVLPFSVSSASNSEVQTGISTVTLPGEPFFRDGNLISSLSSFRDVFRSESVIIPKPGSQTLLVSEPASSPALIVSQSADRKSAAMLVYGLNRWKLGANALTAGQALGYIIANLVSSLADRNEGKYLDVETSAPVYSVNEAVVFNASVRGYEIKGGEKIRLTVKGDSYENSFDMPKITTGEFRYDLLIPVRGLYEYEAVFTSSNGDKIESVTGKFKIGDSNVEYADVKPDASALSEIAAATGGKALSGLEPGQIRTVFEDHSSKQGSSVVTSKSIDLNVNPYYLGLIILLLSAEWFLRKRNNLP